MPKPKLETFATGKHPNSQANLIHEGRPRSVDLYGEAKKQRTLTVTPTGWEGAKNAVKSAGYGSISEFLELLGRGVIVPPASPE